MQSGHFRLPKTVNQLLLFNKKPAVLYVYVNEMPGILYREKEGSNEIDYRVFWFFHQTQQTLSSGWLCSKGRSDQRLT
jgi:hypothetical protein